MIDPQTSAFVRSEITAALSTLGNDMGQALARLVDSKIQTALYESTSALLDLQAKLADATDTIDTLRLQLHQTNLANAALQQRLDDYISADRYTITKTQVTRILSEERAAQEQAGE